MSYSQPYEYKIAYVPASGFIAVKTFSKFLLVQSITGSSVDIPMQISFGGNQAQPLPVGISITMPPTDTITEFQLINVTPDILRVEYALSQGHIESNQFVMPMRGYITTRECGTPQILPPFPPNVADAVTGSAFMGGNDRTGTAPDDAYSPISSIGQSAGWGNNGGAFVFRANDNQQYIYNSALVWAQGAGFYEIKRRLIIYNCSAYPMYWSIYQPTRSYGEHPTSKYNWFPKSGSPRLSAESWAQVDRTAAMVIPAQSYLTRESAAGIIVIGDGVHEQAGQIVIDGWWENMFSSEFDTGKTLSDYFRMKIGGIQ